MKNEWNTIELQWVNGELRWVTIHHRIIDIADIKPSWWQKLRYYIAK